MYDMEELLEEINKLKARVSALESQKAVTSCYESVLGDIDIVSVLNSNQELYIQMCDYVLKHNVIQVMDVIYISHKGKWVKGNEALKALFQFVENKWISSYLTFTEECEELTADQFDKYNNIIYNLNLNKHLSKIKQYINGAH